MISPLPNNLKVATDTGVLKSISAGLMMLGLILNLSQVAAQSCNCTEYIYLNEPNVPAVLKFEVGAGVPLAEKIGANGAPHWYPGSGVSEMSNPHGVGKDLNGRLYIGAEGLNSQIRQLNCDGVINPASGTTINDPGTHQNMFSIGNTLYVNRDGGPVAFNTCTGAGIGQMCLNGAGGNLWGLSYNETTQMVYASQRGAPNKVWAFTRAQLEAGIAGGPCVDPIITQGPNASINPGESFLPNSPGAVFGVTSDNAGNIYVVKSSLDFGISNYILKYNAAGQFIAQTPASLPGGAYGAMIGIVWSETTNRLYISNITDNPATDCISAFDPVTMTYLGTAAANPNLPLQDNAAKAIAIIKECCPVGLPAAFTKNVCGAVGAKFYLNEEAFSACDGVVCGSSWTPTSVNGMTFDPCDNSVTITGANGCGTFSLNIGAVSSTGCAAQTSTFTICNNPTLQVTPTVSGCYQNGGSKATVSVEVSWSNLGVSPTPNDNSDQITVTFGGQTRYINPGAYTSTGGNGTIVSPQVVAFEVNADGSSQTVQVFIGNDYASASCKIQQTGIPLPAPCPSTSCASGQTGGTVFNDYNADGIQQAGETGGLLGVTVSAYDCNGNIVGTTTTDVDGNYVFTSIPTGAYPIRVEFSGLPAVYSQGTLNGSDGRTTVQFVSAADCNIDLGVLNPQDYCQLNPKIVLPCYVVGDPQDPGSANDGALVGVNYDLTGGNSYYATIPQLGTVWGTAYKKSNNTVYSAAFVKRHSGLGPDGLGAIYQTNIGSSTTSLLANVTALGVNLGTIGSNAARGLGAKTAHNADPEAFAKAGKVGMGDIDISEDGSTLYFVNLFERKLHSLNIANPIAAPGVAIPNPGCSGGEFRPWALKVYQGKVYVGVVCDASSSQSKSDLRAYVYAYDITSGTFNTTPVFDFPLTYPKGYAVGGINTGWYPWTDDFPTLVTNGFIGNEPVNYGDAIVYPMPLLSDIEFDIDGSMVLGFMDRIGLQLGNKQLGVDGTGLYGTIVGGDILRAYAKGGTFVLENNGKAGPASGYGPDNNQGPGFGEFYNDDYIDGGILAHAENSQGALAIRPGSGESVYTAMDPVNGVPVSGGFRKVSNTTGLTTGAYTVVTGGGDNGLFLKAQSLGDIELSCGLPTYLQIGNYVWIDTDQDGVQDPCETPLPGVSVSLYKIVAGTPTLVAVTTTGANGEYYFTNNTVANETWLNGATGLLPNMDYKIVFGYNGQTNTAQYAANNLTIGGNDYILTALNVGEGANIDLNDSDASLMAIAGGSYPSIDVTTGAIGTVNHTYDAGFWFCPEVFNGSADQTLCSGVSPSNITVQTNTNAAGSVRFVRFSTDQIAGAVPTPDELYNIYNSGIVITNVTPVGGGIPYTATLTPAAAGWSSLPPGTYYVYAITNPDLGASCRSVQQIVVTLTPALFTDIMVSNVSCFGAADGALNLIVAGGTAPYTYDWSNDGPENPDNDSQDLSGLTPGTYTVTITDVNTCQAITSAVITEPVALTGAAVVTNVVCFGEATGAINFTGSGGTLPYSYDWNNDGPENPDDDTADLLGLTAGTYTITLTDANGCQFMAPYDISQPAAGMLLSITATNATCGFANGALNLSVTNGIAPFNFDWSNDGPDAPPGNDPEDITGLLAGLYLVTVTDATGCTAESFASVNNIDGPEITAAVGTDISCNGGSNGAIDITVTGGTSPLTYDWSNDGAEAPDNDPQDLSGLTAGTYTVTVTDANGCVAMTMVTLTQPTPIFIAMDAQNEGLCGDANGSITATPSGGTGPYTYDWSNDGPETPDNDLPTISGLAAGTYTVTVTDFNGCPAVAMVTLTCVQPASIGNYTWIDADADGIQDGTETPLPNVVVILDGIDINGNSVNQTTATDGTGFYLFDNLWPGNYKLTFVTPAGGYVPTAPNASGSTDANDSDAEPAMGGMTVFETLIAGENNLDYDAGYYIPASIGDIVWLDEDADGVQDTGEPGIIGVTVTLTGTDGLGNPVTLTTTTDANGYYNFSNLVPGTYKLTFTTPAGGYVTTPIDQGGNDATDSDANPAMGGMTVNEVLTSGENNPTYDAGYYIPASIGNYTWIDANANGIQDGGELPISGVNVTLTGTTGSGQAINLMQTTDASGLYLFPNLQPGTYKLTFGTPAGGYVPTTANDVDDPLDAADSDADPLMGGMTVNEVLVSGENNLTYDAGYYIPASIGNYTWIDENGNGVQDGGELPLGGVLVTLTGTDGQGNPVSLTQTTLPDGSYSFTNLVPGTYKLTFGTPAGGYVSTDANQGGNDASDSDADPLMGGMTVNEVLTSGENNTTYDAGYYIPASIGNYTWIDANADGDQDPGESPLPGVVVILDGTTGSGETINLTATTDANGLYLFPGLQPGSYKLTFQTPIGNYVSTTANDVDATDATDSDADPSMGGMTIIEVLTSGENNLTYDAGFYEPASIGNFVWNDTDGDGVQDSGEPGIGGVTVTLTGTDGQGNPVTLTTTTNPDGSYNFPNLVPGTYKLTFTTPAGGYVSSDVNEGGDDATDSDADPLMGGMTANEVLTSGENNTTYDAGYYIPASIGNYTWIDANANGLQDMGELPISGVMVTLTGTSGAGDAVNLTATTDVNGLYLFTGLEPGTYKLTFTTPAGGYVPTMANDVDDATDALDSDADPLMGGMTVNEVLTSGESNLTYDAGYYIPASIGNYTWIDENGNGVQDGGELPLGGILVTLTGTDGQGNPVSLTTTTLPDGSYSFTNLVPGTYKLTFGTTGAYVQTDANQGGNDASDSDADPLMGGMTANEVLTSGENNTTYDAGYYIPASIGNYTWIDANADGDQDPGESPLPGVVVILDGTTGSGETINLTATTDANGLYLFPGLQPGSYKLTFQTPIGNYVSTTANDVDATDATDSDADPLMGGMTIIEVLTSGENNLTYDAGFYEPASIGNFVWNDTDGDGIQDSGEPGIGGVTVTLTGTDGQGNPVTLTTTTNPDGSYNFPNLVPGTYKLTFTTPAGGYVSSDVNEGGDDAIDSDADPLMGGMTVNEVLTSGENNTTYDAGYYIPASIGNYTWIDANANGLQDMGELPISGVMVTLTGTSGAGDAVNLTATTDVNGLYLFTGLEPGTYKLTFTTPAGGYVPTMANDVDDATDALDSDADPAMGGMTVNEVLTSGESNLTYDAGYYIPASIGNYTWIDENGNGVQDGGEPPLGGVLVTLTGTDGQGNPVSLTQTTLPDGSYSFTNLVPGTYKLTFGTPAGGYVSTDANQGGNDASDSDADPLMGGMTVNEVLTSGENNTTYDAGFYIPASIGNYTWIDANADGDQDPGESPLPGVVVILDGTTGSGETINLTATTDANGLYLFPGLQPGSYKLTFQTPIGNYVSTTANDVDATDATDSDADPSMGGMTIIEVLTSGENNLTYDAGFYEPASIGNFVWNDTDGDGIQDSGEPGIGGVTVTLTGTDGQGNPVTLTTTTNPDGSYNFTDLVPGTYKLTFTTPAGGYVSSDVNEGGDDATDSDADPLMGGMTANEVLTSGENNTTYDAGYYIPASIGNYTWIDANANGLQDMGELPISGVMVTLTGTSGAGDAVNLTATTDVNGLYLFTGLEPGTYKLTFTTPAGGYVPTMANDVDDATDALDSDADPLMGGMTVNEVLTSGESNLTYDAGYYIPASIGNYTWIDENGNGVQDGGELPLGGILVTLTGTDGQDNPVSLTTTTLPDGSYSFTNLVPGTYKLTFGTTGAYVQTDANQGGNDASDSDADPLMGGMTANEVLTSGENNTTYDAGYYIPASIGNYTWIDANADGDQDPGESPLPGVVVILDGTTGSGETINLTATTDANGLYLFPGLQPGSYKLTFQTPIGNYVSTTANDVDATDATDSDADPSMGGMTIIEVLTSGENNLTYDAGFYEPASIGNFVWNDQDADGVQDSGEPGIGGVLVTLTGTDGQGNPVTLTTTTAPDGSYLFPNLVPGTYKLTFATPVGFDFTSPLDAGGNDATDSDANPAMGGMTVNEVLTSGENNLTYDAGYYQCPVVSVLGLPINPVCPGAQVGPLLIKAEPYATTVSWSGGASIGLANGSAPGPWVEIPAFITTGEGAPVITVTAILGQCTVTYTFVINVNDDTPPVIQDCPANITVGNDVDKCGANVTFSTPTAVDNCDGNVTVTQTAGPLSGSLFPVGTTTITFVANDGNGNTVSCNFTITVMDMQTPTAVCKDITVNLSATTNGGTVTVTAAQINGGSTDNCPGSLTYTPASTTFTCANVGDNNITLTVTDGAGNTSTCVATVTVLDVTPPVFTCPAPVTLPSCSSTVPNVIAGLTATDNCGVATITQNPVAGLDFGQISGNTVNVTVTVTDVNGNVSTCIVVVTIADSGAPVFVDCPTTMVMIGNDPDQCSGKVNWSIPVALDECLPLANVVQTQGPAPGSVVAITCPPTPTTITYKATDGSGNMAFCTFQVMVIDTEKPEFDADVVMPGDVTVECDAVPTNCIPRPGGACTPLTLSDVNDNCPGPLTIMFTEVSTQDPNVNNCGHYNYTITRTWKITDCADNALIAAGLPPTHALIHVQVITVRDTKAPTALCKNFTATLDKNGKITILPTDINNGSFDNCAPASALTYTVGGLNPLTCANIGANLVTLIVTDPCGNAATCTATVTVVEGIAPCTPQFNVVTTCQGNMGMGNATTLDNGQFLDIITIKSLAMQTWKVTVNSTNNGKGLYSFASALPPTAPILLPVGTLFTAGTADGIDNDSDGATDEADEMIWYTLKALHVDCQGYDITVSNDGGIGMGITSTTTRIENKACYPTPYFCNLLNDPFCLGTPPFTIEVCEQNNAAGAVVPGSITVDGVVTNIFDADALGIGTHTVMATFDAGTATTNLVINGTQIGGTMAEAIADPGCKQKITQIVHIVETPSTLVCNDLVHVSMDADCKVTLGVDDVLEGSYYCYDDYLVEVDKTLPMGNGPWVMAMFDASDIGKTYFYHVIHTTGGPNVCWGEIKIEDKLAPALDCPADITIACSEDTGVSNTGQIGISDCSSYTTVVDEEYTDFGQCNSPRGQIVRTWIVTDVWGNQSSCSQTITITPFSFNELQFPVDVTVNCESAYLNTTATSPDNTGRPSINGFAIGLGGYCTASIGYTDERLESCPGAYVILRKWTVFNQCLPVSGSNPVTHTQVITVSDLGGPVFACPPAVTVSTDALTCCSTAALPDMIVTEGCSNIINLEAKVTGTNPNNGNIITFTVPGHLEDFAGNNWWTPDTLAAFDYTQCLPLGVYNVRYKASDECGNTSYCFFELTVADLVPPVAACDQTTTVGINGDDLSDCYTPADGCDGAGVTWVKATTFDDGSYDNCNQVKVTVRRMAPYSACINALSHDPCYPGGLSEFDLATAELDSIKFYCCEVGQTETVIMRVYQIDLNGNFVPGIDGEPLFNECMVQVEVQDKIKPICQAPANVTVTCEQFDPSLWLYGKANVLDNCCLDTTKVYQGQCGLTHAVNYAQFDTVCNKGTITRTFRAFDCHGQSSQCTQRVVVTYEQDYYVKFPNDVIITVCDGTGNYGEPTYFGEDCELLGTSYTDEIFTVVPDACFKIERSWKIINWCTFNPNGSCINVPNPTPNAISNHPTNLPGPIVSPIQTVGDPWKSTIVKINASDALATNYSVYYDPNANCYTYKQIIKIIDTQDPIVECPASPVSICDLTTNDPLLWNEMYWWDNHNQSHDLCEAPADICLTATDACSGANINFEYQLFLDLDGDGTMETVVNSTQLGNQAGGLGWNNILYGNATGAGQSRQFDGRPVPTNQKWGFAIQETVTGNNKTACVKFNTFQAQNTYVTPQLPHGTHKIKWFVTDGCGNETICEYTIIVKDCKAPTVVCFNGLSVNIMPTGMIQMWATDFLQYSDDNCTLNPWLKYGIRKCGTGTGFPVDGNGNPITNVTFTCDEVGTQCVELWAIDLAGNADYCETYIIIQDNNGNCPSSDHINVSGALATEASDGVEEATVEITGSVDLGTPFALSDLTDSDGLYSVNNSVPKAADVTITPVKDDNPLNGVTTYDLVLISKHILGIQPLDGPYNMIAADANKSNSITTFDIVELRKLILGIYQELPSNTSWRFVDKSFSFTDTTNPFQDAFPENISISDALVNQSGKDFVGVKIGDVNNTVLANANMVADDRSTGTLLMDVNNRDVKAGEEFEVTFKAAEKTQGFQMTLNLDGLAVSEILSGEHVTASNFGVRSNALTVSIDGADAFTVKFRAAKAGKLSDMLHVSSEITKAEAYGMSNADGGVRNELLDVALRFNSANGATVQGVGFELYQNQPNPFVNKTSIGFHLPEATSATLTVYDETGRLVYQQQGDFAKGYNVFNIDRQLISTTGALWYRVETPTDNAVRTMIQTK